MPYCWILEYCILMQRICLDYVSTSRFEARIKSLEARLNNSFAMFDRRLETSERKVESTEQKVDQLASEVKESRVLDVYAFADQSERADYGSNLLKTNCVLITGMVLTVQSYVI